MADLAKIKVPVILRADIRVPLSVATRDVVKFLETVGIPKGLGKVRGYEIFSKIPGESDSETGDLLRPGIPTVDVVDEIGEEIFSGGFRVRAKTTKITWKTVEWRPETGEPIPESGFELRWFGITFDKFTETNLPENEHTEWFTTNFQRVFAFVKAVMDNIPFTEAYIWRKDCTSCFPRVPLLEQEYCLYATSEEEILSNYSSVAGFTEAWDTHEQLPTGQHVVTRGMDILDQNEYWKHSLDSQAKLSRAAKPGLCKYYMPPFGPNYLAHLETYPSFLNQVGYNPHDRTLEFGVFLEEGKLLSVRDFHHLQSFLSNGTTGEDPIDKIVVSFPFKEMAERDAQPLFDMGITIKYYDDAGKFVELKN